MSDSEISKMLKRCGLVSTGIPQVSVKFKPEAGGWPPYMQEVGKRFPDLTFRMTMDAPEFAGRPFVMGCEISGPLDQIQALADELETNTEAP